MPRSRITKDCACGARRTGLRNTAAEESINLRRIARIKAPVNCAAAGVDTVAVALGDAVGVGVGLPQVLHGDVAFASPVVRRVLSVVSQKYCVKFGATFFCTPPVALCCREEPRPRPIKVSLPLIQPQFVIGRHGDIGKVNRAPFDIEDPVGCSARHRGENTAGSTRESRAAAVCIGALVIPVREDGVVVARATAAGRRW